MLPPFCPYVYSPSFFSFSFSFFFCSGLCNLYYFRLDLVLAYWFSCFMYCLYRDRFKGVSCQHFWFKEAFVHTYFWCFFSFLSISEFNKLSHYIRPSLIARIKFILCTISWGTEFWSVNYTSMYNSEQNVSEKIWIFNS